MHTSNQQPHSQLLKKQQLQKFDIFSANQQAKYDAYRSELNEQYARFMAESWERMTAMPAEEIAALGQKAKKRIADAYSWQFITSEYENLFLRNR